jgi:cell division septation protein DedD
MRTVLEREEENDSEITLNATTLLGIFFGLVLICGVFFGFGYSVGRRGTETPAANTSTASSTNTADEDAPPATAAHTPKPSAMETLQAASSPSDTSDANTVTEPVDAAGNTQNAAPTPKAKQAVLTPAPASKPSPASVVAAPPATVKQASLPVAAVNNPTSVAGNGTIMVQIAAVSHQEDANALVSALRQHGYTVSVRNEPQDKLLHVQVGPFPTRDAAKATRTKLLADGYNAILKQ